jgi:AAA ATPase domain/Adenylate and Guanylate cyclase catalytic domain
MRIGINTGLAIVTQIRGESASMTALGDTVNLASRLQDLAEPGSVLLSEATNRLVEGMVEANFAGAHAIKGKVEPQRVYRLDSIRQGATRFEAAVGRGLSAYAGRERELEILEHGLVGARSQIHVIDVMAEPGMGKSRLLHEFRQRIGQNAGNETVFILSGSCSPDGRQTPFLPFIEVVRGSFQVRAGEAEKEVARKLEAGLTLLGLQSQENLGLLLNLLDLTPPEGALAGLDGVLIGVRTRDLLQLLLEARCRLSPVVLLIKDLHWIDSVSEELLGKIVDSEKKLRLLLLLQTRRPEYKPAWLARPIVVKLHLEPLPAGDIRRLVKARLGVEVIPEALARLVTEKAEGNALFAEEIVSFLTERGALRTAVGKVEFDASAVAEALPASVQSLLTARVDRLAPQDRALLQAAAVIGRRFDPALLAVVADDGVDIDTRLAAMQALDLVHPEGRSGGYAFKHALVRDALYQSLLKGPRAAFHLKIAKEIERPAAAIAWSRWLKCSPTITAGLIAPIKLSPILPWLAPRASGSIPLMRQKTISLGRSRFSTSTQIAQACRLHALFECDVAIEVVNRNGRALLFEARTSRRQSKANSDSAPLSLGSALVSTISRSRIGADQFVCHGR